MKRTKVTGNELRARNIQFVRRHKRLPSDLKVKVAAIRITFLLAKPLSQAEWEDGFCHDLHPENEVQIWLQMAVGYSKYFVGKQETQAEGEEVLAVLLTCTSTNDLLEVFDCLKDSGISISLISEVCACYWAARDGDVPTE